MPVETADELGRMMGDVVAEGTGTAAALQGISVAGKTGTAETGHGALNDAWFIAFAPIRGPADRGRGRPRGHAGLRRHLRGADRGEGDRVVLG